jgi:GNAT superfamily N-acetyltransferase
MALHWIREDTPVWDDAKQAIVDSAPGGALELPKLAAGDLAPGEWFRVEEDGVIRGYGWMDCTWGDAEITLAVDQAQRGKGVGAFIVQHLEEEAAARGVNYLYNAVRLAHPERSAVTRWLENLGFQPSGDGLLKKRVRR